MKVAHKVLQQEQHMTSKCKNLAPRPLKEGIMMVGEGRLPGRCT